MFNTKKLLDFKALGKKPSMSPVATTTATCQMVPLVDKVKGVKEQTVAECHCHTTWTAPK